MPNQILSLRGTECKPFKKTHAEQLMLVSSFDWINFDKLNSIEEDIRRIFDQAGGYMDEARKSAILSASSLRLEKLIILPEVQTPTDDLAQDAEQDTAQDYGLKRELS